MSEDEKFEQSVTRVLAWAALIRPDLATRGTEEWRRQFAAECLRKQLRRAEIPEAFRKAFED